MRGGELYCELMLLFFSGFFRRYAVYLVRDSNVTSSVSINCAAARVSTPSRDKLALTYLRSVGVERTFH